MKTYQDRLRQLEIHASFKARYGDFCAVCGRQDNTTVHHIVPQRRGGTDEDSNLICLCRPHHKLADRVTFDDFQKFTMLVEPVTRTDLIDFIRLIVQSGAYQKRHRPQRSMRLEELSCNPA